MNDEQLILEETSKKEELKKIKNNFDLLLKKIEIFLNGKEELFIENIVLFNAYLTLINLKKENNYNDFLNIAEFNMGKNLIFKSQFPFFLFNTSDKNIFFILNGSSSSVFISFDNVIISFSKSNLLNTTHEIGLENIAYKHDSYYEKKPISKKTTNLFLKKLNNLIINNENIKALNFDFDTSLEFYKKYELESKRKISILDNIFFNEYVELNKLLNDKNILPDNVFINTKKENNIMRKKIEQK